MENFEGQLILVIGLNNSLKAEREPFANEYGRCMQNVDNLHKLLDKTIARMVPKAKVAYAPVLKVERDVWNRSQKAQKIYGDLNSNIFRRSHLQFDPEEPLKRGLFDKNDGVHLLDNESVEFWTESFQLLNDQ